MRTNPSKIWRTIKEIDGQKSETKTGAALVKDGKLLEDSTEKANGFIKEYTKVSCIQNRKEDRPFVKLLKRKLRSECECKSSTEAGKCCKPFSLAELQQGINQVQSKSAPGDDQISNAMLKHMSPKAMETMLDIMNHSLRENVFPTTWKKATIIPLLKPGKDPEKLGSYRPICITSCLGKLLERSMKSRLMFILESNGKLKPEQTGFRKLRSTQDQMLRMTQDIADGLNKPKPAKRTVLCLIDFSRAFDSVWHPGLLHKLLNMDLPICYVKWIKSFLQDRSTRVRFENVNSRYRRFKAGTPQGSVISPCIFIMFINDILDDLPEGVKAS